MVVTASVVYKCILLWNALYLLVRMGEDDAHYIDGVGAAWIRLLFGIIIAAYATWNAL